MGAGVIQKTGDSGRRRRGRGRSRPMAEINVTPFVDVMLVLLMGALNRGGFANIGLVTDAGGPDMNDQDG